MNKQKLVDTTGEKRPNHKFAGDFVYRQFQKYLTTKLMEHTFKNDDELYLYMMSFVATVFCVLIHVALLIVFSIHKISLLIGCNIVSLVVYIVMAFFVKKRNYTVVGLMLSFEVIIYTTVTSFFLGNGNFLIGYYLMILVLQLIVPYGPKYMRRGVIIIGFLAVTFCLVQSIYVPPILLLGEGLNNFLLVFNIYVVFAGVMLELYMGNVVRNIITNVNDVRMKELSEQAYTDALTGLYNRRYADLVFEKMLVTEAQRSYCVAMLDIDDFKEVNDTYGHQCGDFVLQYLANFLLQHLRRSDIVFRWGGEEFLIVLEGVQLHSAHRILEKLRIGIAESDIPTPQGVINITVTIGVSELDFESPYESIASSDHKLYEGKRRKKNEVVA